MTFEKIKNYFELSKNSKTKKIAIFTGGKTNRYPVNTYLRLLSPLNELADKYCIVLIDDDSFKQFFDDLKENNVDLDTIIFQRNHFGNLEFNLEFVKSLFGEIKKNNIDIIYDLDDDLLNIEKDHKDYEMYSKLHDVFKFIIINSDVITVSTSYLKDQLIAYNENIKIVPNTLMKLWDFNPKIKNINSKKTIKIGYFGSITHGGDIQLLEKAITTVKQHFKNNEIIFEIVGGCHENHDWINRIDLPHNYGEKSTVKSRIMNLFAYFLNKFNLLRVNLPYSSFIPFMKNEIDWDVGLAPLEDTNINRSKSNLKYLEYTALNVPGIYSNVGPYQEIASKKTGIVVNNDNEWGEAIISLIENSELYETTLKNAYNDVSNNYLVENAALIWDELLNDS